MISIEGIVELFSGLPLAEEDRWTVAPLVDDRVYVSRGSNGEFSLLLEGAVDSFGDLPAWHLIQHSDAVISLPAGRRLSVLRIDSPDPVSGDRVVAHIAYELVRMLAGNPDVDNQALMSGILWMLSILGPPDSLLSTERQSGLAGECILLRRLLTLAHRGGLEPSLVLRRWKGPGGGLRDFAACGMAIEAKCTGDSSRVHHFRSIEQLDSQAEDEMVFLFSVGLRRDTSAPKKLPDFVEDVRSGLVRGSGEEDLEARAIFAGQLAEYGYSVAQEGLYRNLPGFQPPHLLPALFEDKNLERVRKSSFTEGRLPGMVLGVGYTLDVSCPPLRGPEAEAVLVRFLMAPEIE